MAFSERSYSGKLFRPTPEVHIEDDGSFGVIATAWGNRQAAKKTIDILTDYILSARQDMEATSPFQKLTCLSPLANNLRAGVMLVNDSIYREDNKAEYISGVEVLVFARADGELSYAHVGAPNLLLARTGLPWIPISVHMDLSAELGRAPTLMAPMPQNLLGLHSTSNLNVGSFKTHAGDRLIFLSHSLISVPLTTLTYEQTSLEQVSSVLSSQYNEMPFWLGILDLAT